MTSDSVVILSASRTPMGSMLGALSDIDATRLGGTAIASAINKSGLDPALIDNVLMGCVLTAGLGQAPARRAANNAQLDASIPATAINKVCGSGMYAAMISHDQIKAGSIDVAVAGGMENMSKAPYMLPKARAGYRMGNSELLDHMFFDGLQNSSDSELMGCLAQRVADQNGITREEMDNFTIQSIERAQQAIADGLFTEEIVAVETISRKKVVTTVDTDEAPGNARVEKIPKLRPVFAEDGTITAASASPISDGAAAIVLASQTAADNAGQKPLARIVSHAVHARQPADFTLAPIGAMQKVMDNAGWEANDVDLFEINEAFASVPLAASKELGIGLDKINVNGGAIALGHPLGTSGARIVVTLLHALQQTGGRRGVASLCIGGGEGTALAIELM